MAVDASTQYNSLGARRNPLVTWLKVLLWLVVLAGLAFYVYQHFSQQAQAPQPDKRDAKRNATVGVVAVKTQDVKRYLDAIGTVTPRNTVVVHSRIDGQLTRVLFKEGQYIKQGELLAEVDPRVYQVQLAQAQGQLAKDQALLKNAQLDLERYKKLLAQDSAPEQQVATQNALVNQYIGTLQTDQSQIDNAKLYLSYTRITAPISGRVGLRLVDAGNIVHASDATGIVSIAQVKPITVVFSIPQDDLSPVLDALRKGQKLAVDVLSRDQQNQLGKGELLSTDNQIDATTGTVKLKAQFANDDENLFPNQFVNVRVLLGTQKNATVVSNAAIQRGTQGTFVYQVLPNQTIKIKPVKVLVTEAEFSAVEADLKEGDSLVISGADKLRDGAKVKVAKAERGGADKAPHAHAAGDATQAAPAASADASVEPSQHRHHKRPAAE
jgi:membrane fusion protein, multidrug efflux system